MGVVRYGLNPQLEEHATALIMADLEGVTSREAKSDILTPWKERHRQRHEIQSRTGAPIDPSVRRGNFYRAFNPVHTHLNSYEGPTRPMRMSSDWDPDEAAPTGMLSPQMAAIMGVERTED